MGSKYQIQSGKKPEESNPQTEEIPVVGFLRLTPFQKEANKRLLASKITKETIEAGLIHPSFKAGMIAFLCAIDEKQMVKIGEGKHQTSEPAFLWFKGFLEQCRQNQLERKAV